MIRWWVPAAATLAALVLAGCGPSAARTDFVELPGLGQTRIDVPRPSRAGDACTVSIPENESVTDRVGALRGVGLFADRGDLSDAELATAIQSDIVARWGELPEDSLEAELLIAERDEARVWWRDLEADVDESNQVYVTTLHEWAAISEGVFVPGSITETWSSAAGPIDVSFTLAGEELTLRPDYLEDWIDPRILDTINERLAPEGRRFTLFQAFDQTAVVLALTADERSALENRGWCFD